MTITMRPRGLADRLGAWSAAHSYRAIGLWLLTAALLTVLGGVLGQRELTATQLAHGESHRALAMLHRAGLDLPAQEAVFVHSDQLRVGTPGYTSALRDTLAALHATGQVTVGDSVSAAGAPSGPVSADRHSTLLRFSLTGAADTAEDRVGPVLDAVRTAASRHRGMTIGEFGEASYARQAQDEYDKDYRSAEQLTYLATFGILLVVFGALVAALLPVLLAGGTLLAAGGLLAAASHLLPVDANATTVMALVGIAVGVDYALFYIRRFRAELSSGRDARAAVEVAAATSGRTILISGLAVLIAMAGLFLAGDAEETAIAEAAMAVVIAAMIGSVTLLPAILALLGRRVSAGGPPRRWRGALSRSTDRAWTVLLRAALRRPAATLTVSAGALILVLLPAFSLRTADSGIADSPASHIPVMQTYQRIQQVFPDRATAATVVYQPRHPVEATSALAAFEQRVAHSRELRGPVIVDHSGDGRLVRLRVGLAGNGTDRQSVHALSVLRHAVIPATLAADGGQVAVAGSTAQSVDYSHRIAQRTPLVAGFVLLLTLLMMLAAFRSPVIAALTVLLNTLSVGAAFGVLVAIFQYGWGAHLLGFTSTGGITSWVPLFLFVLLFGLSMDYHVYAIASVRESRLRGMSAGAAVQHGIHRSAGVISGAATAMITVAAVFGLMPQTTVKQAGIGLATAILLDATLIRMLLLPAALTLLGNSAWPGRRPTRQRSTGDVPESVGAAARLQ